MLDGTLPFSPRPTRTNAVMARTIARIVSASEVAPEPRPSSDPLHRDDAGAAAHNDTPARDGQAAKRERAPSARRTLRSLPSLRSLQSRHSGSPPPRVLGRFRVARRLGCEQVDAVA